MDSVRIKGYLTPDGKIEVELPEHFIAGEIEFDIPVLSSERHLNTLGDIFASGLVGIGVDGIPDDVDSQVWVDKQREKPQQNRQQRWTDSYI